MADMYERKPQKLTGPGGDQKELRVKYIDNLDGTWSLSVGAISLPLPDGAATAAKQDTTNAKLDDVITALGGSVSLDDVIMREDSGDANIIYIGEAATGSSQAGALWKITKLDVNTLLDVTYADGNDNYDNVWNNRESLSYS